MSKSDLVAKEFGEQWKKKHINQRLIGEMLPSAQLKVFSDQTIRY